MRLKHQVMFIKPLYLIYNCVLFVLTFAPVRSIAYVAEARLAETTSLNSTNGLYSRFIAAQKPILFEPYSTDTTLEEAFSRFQTKATSAGHPDDEFRALIDDLIRLGFIQVIGDRIMTAIPSSCAAG